MSEEGYKDKSQLSMFTTSVVNPLQCSASPKSIHMHKQEGYLKDKQTLFPSHL